MRFVKGLKPFGNREALRRFSFFFLYQKVRNNSKPDDTNILFFYFASSTESYWSIRSQH
ncbi:MAG: hypothetical protein KME64_19055 [Scytonematopsis contorta HA4267-MV1]|nr:hypothetical protein [Scytonematopsis contorta HA4267-MV1]